MRVDVRGRGEIAVPQPLLNLLERDAVRQQERHAAVAQAVEGESWCYGDGRCGWVAAVLVAVGGGAHGAAGEVAASGVLAVGGDEHVPVGVGREVAAELAERGLGTAALLANDKTRRAGGLLAALLFVAVFPANIQMALDARNQSTQRKAIAYGRLPLQLPMICGALKIWRKSK